MTPGANTAMEFGTFDPDEFAEELRAAPRNDQVGTRLLFENDRVRVWDLRVGPGERAPFHCHTRTYFFVCVGGGRVVNRFPDGNSVTMDVEEGATWFSDLEGRSEIHDLENVGATEVRFTTVELL